MVSMFLPQISQLSSQCKTCIVVRNLSIFLDTLYSICFYLCPDSYSVPDTQSVWQAAELPLSYWGYHCNLCLMFQIATCRTPKCAVKAYVRMCMHELMLLHPGSREMSSLWFPYHPRHAKHSTHSHANTCKQLSASLCLHISLIKYSLKQHHSPQFI